MNSTYYFTSKEKIESFISKFPPENFDFVIIGSSIAAASICKPLLKKNKKILIIERGSLFNPKITYHNDIHFDKLPIDFDTKVLAYGGTSNTWKGVVTEVEDFELNERWKFPSYNAWGIKYEDLIKYNKSAWKLLNIKKRKFYFNNLLKKRFTIRGFQVQKKPFRSVSIIKDKRIIKLLNAYAESIGQDRKGCFINIHSTKTESNIKIYCKKIIICTGGLDTNKLLLKSIVKGNLNLGKRANNVGKFYMNHPKLYLGRKS